jgi:hypothetical protein
MNKLKLALSIFVVGGMALSSCVKHEIIPEPEPLVDLDCHFQGFINGTDLELTQNVDGYTCIPEKQKTIVPSPDYSSAIYYSQMSSQTNPVFVKISMGSVMFDAVVTQDPTLTQFNAFFTNNLTPAYSDNATAGFEVQYRDNAGNIWVSHQNSTNAQSVVFSGIKQESDVYGDYSKFTCSFSCYVYKQNMTTMLWDSINIQNAVYKGWFKR